MANLFNHILQFFRDLWNFRRNRKIKKINKQLVKEVKDQEKERRIFLNEFRFYLRKYLRKDASGKYIPIKGKNTAEIYTTIMAVHGEKLKALNLKFTKNLDIKL
jgi:ribosomal protein L35AE/L33A